MPDRAPKRPSAGATTPPELAPELGSTALALADALESRLPAGPVADDVRARFEFLRQLPPVNRMEELPSVLSAFEGAVAGSGGDAQAEHEAIRRLVQERHTALMGSPSFADWLEAPRRHSAMFAWLMRDHLTRLEQAGATVERHGEETQLLQVQLARLRQEHENVLLELERCRSLADVGLLAAGIVHDFNNVLTVIGGYASIARVADGAQRQLSLERIAQATQRAAEMSRTLLRWVRHDRPRPEIVDLNPLVSEVLDLLAPSAPTRVIVSRQLGANLPLVTADPIEIRRIVLNLVTNAWQAVGEGSGEVVVRTALAEGRFREVWIEVADDGRGMSADVSARVFEPFFSTREGGSGLGLSTVQQIVDRLGGRVEVWSEPGKGARFRVSLPAPIPA